MHLSRSCRELCLAIRWIRREVFLYRAFPLVLLAILGSNCTMTHNISFKPPLEDLPELKRASLTMGASMPEDFVAYSHRRIFGPHEYVASVGQASTDMFNTLFPRVFAKVVRLERFPLDNVIANGLELDGVIEPRIEDFDFRLGMDKDSEEFGITYRITVFTPEGVPVASWTVRGKAILDSTPFPIYRHVDADLDNAAKRFLIGFEKSFAPAVSALTAAKQSTPDQYVPHKEDIVLTLETMNDPALAASEYGYPLPSAGIVALRISMLNKGSRKILFRETDARFTMPSGKIIPAATAATVVSRLERASNSGAVAAALTNSIFGVLVVMAEETEKYEKRQTLRKNIQERGFGERWLLPGESARGFLLFIPPKDSPAFDRGELTLWFVNPETGRGLRYLSPVEKVGFSGGLLK